MAGMYGTALVYSGTGAGTRSVLSAIESLRRALRPSLLVDTLDASELLQGTWTQRCRVLVMPGGADLPYCKYLNGPGNAIIRQYVQEGGAYVGLCAGAYYACSKVEFELGTTLEVEGDRELGFYPGIAQGSIYKGFDYQSEAGAVAAPIRFRKQNIKAGRKREIREDTWSSGNQEIWQECRDYINGGPGFLLPTQRNSKGKNPSTRSGAVGKEFASLFSLSTQSIPGVDILATFPEHADAAAAVACRVGLGRAVLCSTHPELAAEWLARRAGAGRSDAVLATGEDLPSLQIEIKNTDERSSANNVLEISVNDNSSTVDDQHVEALRKELQAHASGRWALWNALLLAAGLEDVLVSSERQGYREEFINDINY